MIPRSRLRCAGAILLGIVVCVPSMVRADGRSIARVEVFPTEISLHSARDRQPFIVQAVRADEVTLDITDQVEAAIAEDAIARVEAGVIYPVADGAAELKIRYEEHDLRVPIVIHDATIDPPISFRQDVMPVLMRAGCNTGSCHGAARGKDGFMLSLFGYDPAGDHHRITREISGRRINLALPESSLFMEKAVGAVPHTGGKRFDVDSEYYDTLMRWLLAKAPNDPGEVPAVVRVELYPPRMVLEGEGARQQMIVRAHYADGTDRDVTHLAVFLSNNDNSAAIEQNGVVTAGARGEAFVMARFSTHTVGSQAIVLPADLDYTPPNESPANYVDELVNAKLQKLRLLPSELCTDDVFLRRVTLDIIGRFPTAEEFEAFMADERTDKRARAIDELLMRKEFSEIWAMKWAELLMIRSTNTVSYKSAFLYASWLTEQISNDVPLDAMVRDLLSASGGTFKTPATNYYQIEPATLQASENVAQVFMGIRTQCAQCHNHPFDRWTMDDYYGFAAFFSQVGRKTGEDYRETIVFNSGGGEVKHPVDGRVMPPKFLGGEVPDLQGRDRRAVLAECSCHQKIRTFPPASPIAFGPISLAWASSSRSTISALAIRPATPNCSTHWPRS